MTPRQFLLSSGGASVLPFYDLPGSVESAGAPFSIDDQPGVLRAADISAALGLQAVKTNSEGYRDWPQPTQREMVRILARDTTAGTVLFRRQLSP